MGNEKTAPEDFACEHYSPTFKKTELFKTDCLFRMNDDGNCGLCSRDETYRCIKEVSMLPIPLSQSTIGDFVTCPWLYYLKNIKGIQILNNQMSKAAKMGQLLDCGFRNLFKPGSVNMGKVVEDYEIENFEIGKVRAIIRAYKTLGIKIDDGFELQAMFDKEIDIPGVATDGTGKVKIKGFYDRKYKDYFVEGKLSSRPDNYFDVFFINSQVGSYFLADNDLKYCVMEVVRTPDLKSTGKFKEESAEEHEERTYQDIISRPSFYFIGLDKTTSMFGKKYYRSEFNVDEIKHRFRSVNIMIHDLQLLNGWYKNDKACGAILPGIPCDMKPICRYNVMSETMYGIRKKRIVI